MFTLVNAVLIRGLPFPDADRLYVLGVKRQTSTGGGEPISRPDLLDWRAGTKSYEGLAGFVRRIDDRERRADVSGGHAGRLDHRQRASTCCASRCSSAAASGPATTSRAPSAVVILGHALWQSRYRGDRGVIGLPVRVNGEPGTVIGVMPPGIKFPTNAELWVSAIPLPDQIGRRDIRNFTVFARLKPGVTAAQAQAELDGVVKRLAAAYPASNKELTVGVVQTFNERFNAGPVRVVFLTLMGAVGFVLLIACANVANLLLSRSTARAREVAVRYAMGATRWRVVRQLLVESLLLAVAGGVIGLGIAVVGTRLFDRAVADVGKPYWIQFTIDGVVIAYLVAICVGTSLIFGLAPALQVARTIGRLDPQAGRPRQHRLAADARLLVGAGRPRARPDAGAAGRRRPDGPQLHGAHGHEHRDQAGSPRGDAHQPAARQLPDGGAAGAVLRAADAAAGQPARRRRRGGDDERAAVRAVDPRGAGRRPARRRPRQAARSRLRDRSARRSSTRSACRSAAAAPSTPATAARAPRSRS